MRKISNHASVMFSGFATVPAALLITAGLTAAMPSMAQANLQRAQAGCQNALGDQFRVNFNYTTERVRINGRTVQKISPVRMRVYMNTRGERVVKTATLEKVRGFASQDVRTLRNNSNQNNSNFGVNLRNVRPSEAASYRVRFDVSSGYNDVSCVANLPLR